MHLFPSYILVEQLITQERGFDLNDDAEQLDTCQDLAQSDNLTAYGWRLYGVLLYRADRFQEAVEVFNTARTKSETPARDAYLAAYALLRSGASAAALAGFDHLLQEEGKEKALAHHGRGDALWLLGQPQAAEAAYLAAIAENVRAETWYDLARLRASQQDPAGALEALDQCLTTDKDIHQAQYLKAALCARTEAEEAALEALEAASFWDEQYIDQARTDESFAALQENERFKDLTTPPPPDLGWLDRFPELAALRDDPKLRDLGIRFVAEEDAQDAGESLRAYYADTWHLGILWGDQLWAACQEVAEDKWLLAEGPSVHDRKGIDLMTRIYFDPQQPERLWLAPSAEFPAALFVDIPAETTALQQAVAQLYPQRRIPVLELPQVRRAFMGTLSDLMVPDPYSGEWVHADFHTLDRHWNFSPALDVFLWGSAQADDPWPEQIPPQPAYSLKISSRLRQMRAQQEGGVCRFTRRTFFSRSQVAYELHQLAIYIWEIRYIPNPFPQVVERFNATLDTDYPPDLPIDVIAAIHGFNFMETAELEAMLKAGNDPEMLPSLLRIIAAVRHSDLTVTDLLRAFIDHEDLTVRGTIANLCIAYHWVPLIVDLGLNEQHPELRRFIERVVGEGISPPQYNEMGEPVGLYDDDDDDDDEEGE